MKNSLLAVLLILSINTVFSQINNEHLKIGESAPQIIGVDQFNKSINSDIILKKKKILLVFYRGNWCPYCKKHLASLQDNLKEITEKGVYVIVVTPEKVEKIQETTKKLNANFSILHDVDNRIMNTYKVAFEVNKQNVPNYLDATLKVINEYNESQNNVLPVPATYIINTSKKIEYVHYNPDYKQRSNFKELLTYF